MSDNGPAGQRQDGIRMALMLRVVIAARELFDNIASITTHTDEADRAFDHLKAALDALAALPAAEGMRNG